MLTSVEACFSVTSSWFACISCLKTGTNESLMISEVNQVCDPFLFCSTRFIVLRPHSPQSVGRSCGRVMQ